MKKLFTLLFIFSLCVLAACGGENTPPTEETAEWEPFPYELMFQVGYSHETHSEDGTLVCSCHHEIPKLLPSGELTTAQQTSVDAFHAAMDEILAGSRLLYDSLSETALADYAYRTVTGLGWDGYYTDEMTYTAHTTPYAVAIDFKGYTYAGGPHPGEGNVCYLFDLEKGAMASIDEISDGEAFRSALAEEILRQIAENGLAPSYYEDYERERGDPIPIYPNFKEKPVYTSDGKPFVTQMQEICGHGSSKFKEGFCVDCKYFKQGEELIGVCQNPINKNINKR